jgi:hypothetical protein
MFSRPASFPETGEKGELFPNGSSVARNWGHHRTSNSAQPEFGRRFRNPPVRAVKKHQRRGRFREICVDSRQPS